MEELARSQKPTVLLTVKEVGERLRLGRTMVHRLIAEGRLRSVKIGSARRVPESEVERFITESLASTARVPAPW